MIIWARQILLQCHLRRLCVRQRRGGRWVLSREGWRMESTKEQGMAAPNKTCDYVYQWHCRKVPASWTILQSTFRLAGITWGMELFPSFPFPQDAEKWNSLSSLPHCQTQPSEMDNSETNYAMLLCKYQRITHFSKRLLKGCDRLLRSEVPEQAKLYI